MPQKEKPTGCIRAHARVNIVIFFGRYQFRRCSSQRGDGYDRFASLLGNKNGILTSVQRDKECIASLLQRLDRI